eukprot:4389433-Prymnesium_polylepis.1
MFVRLVELAVRWRSRVPADRERRAGEVAAQANVKGHIGVVCVHIQAEIFARAVLHHERVVAREGGAGLHGVQD